MQHDLLASLRRVPDDELLARIEHLAARERGATALLVAHLAELDTRDAHLRQGHSSLFAYCRDALALSEHEAYNRIEAARAARRFPVILDLLEAGALNLTSVRLLAPHLTERNHRRVLESARGKRKPEVEEIVARLAPRPDVPTSVRRLPSRGAGAAAVSRWPAPASSAASSPASNAASSALLAPGAASIACVVDVSVAAATSVAIGKAGSIASLGSPHTPVSGPPEPAAPAAAASPAPPAIRPPRPASVVPLSPDRYELRLTIGRDTLDQLRRAQDLLRHAVPSGDEAAILHRALAALLVELERRKLAATETPRPWRGAARGSRHIPAAVKRAVWRRDLGRCAFVGSGGRRCRERAFLELHHVRPYAAGGEATPDNIQLRCRRHNQHEARVYFAPLREYAAGARGHDGAVRRASSGRPAETVDGPAETVGRPAETVMA